MYQTVSVVVYKLPFYDDISELYEMAQKDVAFKDLVEHDISLQYYFATRNFRNEWNESTMAIKEALINQAF
jgi:hypothetical protein